MKKLLLMLLLIFCFVQCDYDPGVIRSDYFEETEVDYTQVILENSTCACGVNGTDWLRLSEELYVCPNCGRRYKLIAVGDLRVVMERP